MNIFQKCFVPAVHNFSVLCAAVNVFAFYAFVINVYRLRFIERNVKLKVIKCELGEPDERGRRRPVEVEGSEYEIEADCVIMAIGTSPNPLIKNTTDGLATNSRGGIIVEESTENACKLYKPFPRQALKPCAPRP